LPEQLAAVDFLHTYFRRGGKSYPMNPRTQAGKTPADARANDKPRFGRNLLYKSGSLVAKTHYLAHPPKPLSKIDLQTSVGRKHHREEKNLPKNVKHT
jgi:hypothetical protein